jgi:hypothetical protein
MLRGKCKEGKITTAELRIILAQQGAIDRMIAVDDEPAVHEHMAAHTARTASVSARRTPLRQEGQGWLAVFAAPTYLFEGLSARLRRLFEGLSARLRRLFEFLSVRLRRLFEGLSARLRRLFECLSARLRRLFECLSARLRRLFECLSIRLRRLFEGFSGRLRRLHRCICCSVCHVAFQTRVLLGSEPL